MELFFGMLLLALIVQVGLTVLQLKELGECRRQLKTIASLTRDTRSSQGSIGIHQSSGVTPIRERAKQQGPRSELPLTGKMRQGLKFKRVGGEFERNRDEEGD
jgi:hypothetical protein